jgi:hypothetical protein
MDDHSTKPVSDLETVLDTDRAARLSAIAEIEKFAKSSDLLIGRTV